MKMFKYSIILALLLSACGSGSDDSPGGTGDLYIQAKFNLRVVY